MEHVIKKGYPIQINWTLHSIAGEEFSLQGYMTRLYYANGSYSSPATGVTFSGNTLTWSFTPTTQWKTGDYDIFLELYSSGRKIITLHYPKAFALWDRETTINDQSTVVQTSATNINITSSCDFYRFAPVVPVVGDDGYWYVNGQKVLDGHGEYVLSSHTLEYDPETMHLIIDRGRVDSEGHSIQQTITDIAAIVADLEDKDAEIAQNIAQYAANEAGRVSAESLRVAAEASRASAEAARATAETARASAESSRASAETARVSAENARISAENGRATAETTRVSNENSRKNAETARASAESSRATAETARASAETNRASAELARASAEADREEQAAGDHTTAVADHSQASTDHSTAASDHTQASQDHTIAASDHTQAGSDHTTAAADHTQAASDHTTAASDHTTAAADHTQAGTDHTQAGTDHTTAASDHTTAEADHALYEADHAVMQGYDDRLDAVEKDGKQFALKFGPDVSLDEIEATPTFASGYVSNADGSIKSTTGIAEVATVQLGEAKSIRFYGCYLKTGSNTAVGYAFYDANGQPLSYGIHDFDRGASDVGSKEYIVEVPVGAVSLKTSTNIASGAACPKDDFYCYLRIGKNVGDVIAENTETVIKQYGPRLLGELEDGCPIPNIIDGCYISGHTGQGGYAGLVAASGWSVIGPFKVKPGDVLDWNFGDDPTTVNMCYLTADFLYKGATTSNGYNKKRSVTIASTSESRYVLASFYSTIDKRPNLTPLLINGVAVPIIREPIKEQSGKWKPLPLGEVVNGSISNRHIVVGSSTQVVMKDEALFPFLPCKLRIRAINPAGYIYGVRVYYNNYSSLSTADGTNQSGNWHHNLDYRNELQYNKPSNGGTALGYRLGFTLFQNVGGNLLQCAISAATVNAEIQAGTFAVEYYDEEEGINERTESQSPRVWAMRRILHVAEGERYINQPDMLPCIAHISDLHGDGVRFANFMDFADYLGVDVAVNSGDMVRIDHTDGTGYMADIAAKHTSPFLFAVGNHEARPTGTAQPFEENIAALVERYGYLKAANTATDKAYYYKDFADRSLRMIVINYYEDSVYEGRLGQAQITWFIDTLAATPSGYGVIVVMHAPEDTIVASSPYDKFLQPEPKYSGNNGVYVGDRPIMHIVDAFISRSTLSYTYDDHSATYNGSSDVSTETVNVLADFTGIAASIEFIAYVSGHRHEDFVGYYADSTNLQLNLCITTGSAIFGNSAYSAYANQSDLGRYGRGLAQDAFNIYGIDRENGTVRIARVGSDMTVRGDMRDVLIIPYK